MIENNQNTRGDQNSSRSQSDDQMNEQNISRDTNGRPKDNNMPSEPGGREEAWQTKTEDMGGQPSGYTGGDKRQDRDLTQPDQNQGYSEGRDQSMRGR